MAEWKELCEGTFRGCALICRKNEIVFEHAYGFADYYNQVPNHIGTKFATASAGKVFTAVGILQLAEKGMLRLDDRIGELLPIDLHEIDGRVTVKELLTHTSGIPDYFDESVMKDYEELWVNFPNYRIRSNRDLLPLFIDKPMMYPRGSRFHYNNSGFVFLAMILEEISGMGFDQYLKKHVFDVCGMHNTGYYELDRLPAGCASNYIYDQIRGDFRTNIFSVDAKGTGAGGAFTTVHDIERFWRHLLGGRLLSEAMTADMMTAHDGGNGCYGYGMWLKTNEDYDIPYFQGSDPGVSFLSAYDPKKEVILVLVSNYGDPVGKLWKNISAGPGDKANQVLGGKT